MCYSVYLSTNSKSDLSQRNSDLVRFERLTACNSDPCTVLLEHEKRWYIGSRSGCSCSFRHLSSTELGFSDPVHWYDEDKEDIEATKELYSTLSDLISSGHQVDLLDVWHGTETDDIVTITVSLNEITGTSFRLFENHKFKLI